MDSIVADGTLYVGGRTGVEEKTGEAVVLAIDAETSDEKWRTRSGVRNRTISVPLPPHPWSYTGRYTPPRSRMESTRTRDTSRTPRSTRSGPTTKTTVVRTTETARTMTVVADMDTSRAAVQRSTILTPDFYEPDSSSTRSASRLFRTETDPTKDARVSGGERFVRTAVCSTVADYRRHLQFYR